MNFWKDVANFEKSMLTSINSDNALKLRDKSQFCASLIETAKFSMNIGRTNRAWAYLIMAKMYWNSTRVHS
jgi:recombinational DNA repair protein RecT